MIDSQTSVCLFRINAINGSREIIREQDVFDTAYAHLLAKVPEFTLMRRLLVAYHVVSAREN